nr:hypothetical protein [Vibrio sp. 0908]
MMEDNDNIVEFKPAEKDTEKQPIFKQTTTYRRRLTCPHGNFTIDESTDTISCGMCNAQLSPMWVLKELANKNSQLYWHWVDMQKRVEKTRNKMRCKCQHCGQMTAIQR